MCSNTKKQAVIYPAVYCKQNITPPHKIGYITATIERGYDGYGTRPHIMYYEDVEDV